MQRNDAPREQGPEQQQREEPMTFRRSWIFTGALAAMLGGVAACEAANPVEARIDMGDVAPTDTSDHIPEDVPNTDR